MARWTVAELADEVDSPAAGGAVGEQRTAAAQAAFLARLDARRRLIATLWARHPELQGWVDYSRRWG